MTRWPQLEQFLNTDPRDVGCGEAMSVLHIYVDLLESGRDPEHRYPGVAAHLAACGPCNEDFHGLLSLAREERAKRHADETDAE